MPLYEYRCKQCGSLKEVRHAFKEPHTEPCSECAGEMARVFTPAGIVFKGAGFYVTDSRKSSAGKPGDAKSGDAKSGDAKSGDTKSGDTTSGDGKPADAKSSDAKPSETKSSDAKPSETKSSDSGKPSSGETSGTAA